MKSKKRKEQNIENEKKNTSTKLELCSWENKGAPDDGHSNRGEVESYYGFDLHFLYGQGSWAFFHVFMASTPPPTNVGKDAGKKEPSYTDGGNIG
jgi:hypothetical protein